MTLSRRDFLMLGAALAPSWARRAWALGAADQFQMAALSVGSGQVASETRDALRRILWEIARRTSIDAALEPAVVRADSPDLARYPFLYLTGDRALSPWPEAPVARLRRLLRAGGMLLIDGNEGGTDGGNGAAGGFDASVRRLCERLFPQQPLARLPADHVLYKSFYLLDGPAGRVLNAPYLEAVIHDERTTIVYCRNDLGGAWARDELGQWAHPVFPGGERQRELAIRLGVNLAMYATCLDYKTDQVHVPFILRRRQWRAP